MTCGMCARICWRCAQHLDRLKEQFAEWDEHIAELEIAWMEADDSQRETLAQRLQDAIEAQADIGDEIAWMEAPE